eukprot:CAMPEP_0198270142 /NCGR_PEP_ID=MMETSP1447-20131203/43942_1 /TAXON_ID=420782 /ORGANISM="Chaetoceros dichaeta, Strain CCMP1751" /LENGTH=66 /DNA_ID=CAMNT_0043962029 /DNA_START=11 /DNA_END=211 /DNA_ORIENTATION=-
MVFHQVGVKTSTRGNQQQYHMIPPPENCNTDSGPDEVRKGHESDASMKEITIASRSSMNEEWIAKK